LLKNWTLVILIIDDSPLWVERLISILKSVNSRATIKQATNYSDGISQLNSNPDFVFLDIHLREKKGIELLKHIKKNYPQLLVCVISNEVNETVKELCFEIGADEFLDISNEFHRVPDFIEKNTFKKKKIV